jgi:hypothetical protein
VIGSSIAHVHKDTLTKTVQWWKHLRPYWKRRQQRRERVAAAKLIRAEWAEQIERKKNSPQITPIQDKSVFICG